MRFVGPDSTLEFDGNDMNTDLFENPLPFEPVKNESEMPFEGDPFEYLNLVPSNAELITSLAEPITTASMQNASHSAPKHSILLQQLQQDTKSDWHSDDILTQLLREASSPVGAAVPSPELKRELQQLDVTPQMTLQLLTNAGIQQPGKRQIQLHSELARHLASQLTGAAPAVEPAQPSAKVHLPLQIQLAAANPTKAPVMSQIITNPQKSQKIIVQQIQRPPAQSQPKALPSAAPVSNSQSPPAVFLPQQIIITSQPQQQVQPQPQAINLQQLQVSWQPYRYSECRLSSAYVASCTVQSPYNEHNYDMPISITSNTCIFLTILSH